MSPATPPPGAQEGRYSVQCASSAAAREWDTFCKRNPEAALAAYERLSQEPLLRIVGRQFPLKGKRLKPFWEYEATSSDRIYYAVCIQTKSVIIAVSNKAHTGAAVSKIIRDRSKVLVRVLRKE